MTLSQNQFKQSMVKGILSGRPNFNSLPVQLHSTSAGGVVPAQAVKLYDAANGVPFVVEITADTEEVFGFVNYNYKDATFAALQNLEISRNGNVMYMEAAAAFAVGTDLMCVVAGSKVATATGGGTKKIIGRALDKATAAGDIVRVEIILPCTLKA